MLTIEHAFNAIWKVKAARPFLRRLVMHLAALLVGPLVFGGSLVAITYLASVSFGLVDEPRWVNTLFFKVVPFLIMAVLFALVYWAVPNRPIRPAHAATAGLLAAAGFTLMQRLFSLYVAKLSDLHGGLWRLCGDAGLPFLAFRLVGHHSRRCLGHGRATPCLGRD